MSRFDYDNFIRAINNSGLSSARNLANMFEHMPQGMKDSLIDTLDKGGTQESLSNWLTNLSTRGQEYLNLSERQLRKKSPEEIRFAESIRRLERADLREITDQNGPIFIRLNQHRSINAFRKDIELDIAYGNTPDINDTLSRHNIPAQHDPVIDRIITDSANRVQIRDHQIQEIAGGLFDANSPHYDEIFANNFDRTLPQADQDAAILRTAQEKWVEKHTNLHDGEINRDVLFGRMTQVEADNARAAIRAQAQADAAERAEAAAKAAEREAKIQRVIKIAKVTTGVGVGAGAIAGGISLFSNSDDAAGKESGQESGDDDKNTIATPDLSKVKSLKDIHNASTEFLKISELMKSNTDQLVAHFDTEIEAINKIQESKRKLGDNPAVEALETVKKQVIELQKIMKADPTTLPTAAPEFQEYVHNELGKVKTLHDEIIATTTDDYATHQANIARLQDQNKIIEIVNTHINKELVARHAAIGEAITKAQNGIAPAVPLNLDYMKDNTTPGQQQSGAGGQQQQQSGTGGQQQQQSGATGQKTDPKNDPQAHLPPAIKAIYTDASYYADYSQDANKNTPATLSDGTKIQYGISSRLASTTAEIAQAEQQIAKVEQLQIRLRNEGKNAEATALENSVLLDLKTNLAAIKDSELGLKEAGKAALTELNKINGMTSASQLADAQQSLNVVKNNYITAEKLSQTVVQAKKSNLSILQANPVTSQMLKDEISNWQKSPNELLQVIGGGKEGIAYQLFGDANGTGKSVASGYLSLAWQKANDMLDGWKEYGKSLKTQGGRNMWMLADIGGKVVGASMVINLFNNTLGGMAGFKIDGWKSLAILGVVAAMSIHGTGDIGRDMEMSAKVRNNQFGTGPLAQTGGTLDISGKPVAGANIPNSGSVAMMNQKTGQVESVASFNRSGDNVKITAANGEVVNVAAKDLDKMARNLNGGQGGNVPMNFDATVAMKAPHSDDVSDAMPLTTGNTAENTRGVSPAV